MDMNHEESYRAKGGLARFGEVLDRDGVSFFLAGLLSLLSMLPMLLGWYVFIRIKAFVPLILAGAFGGMLAAPQICGLFDIILRSLRDEAGDWRLFYQRAWKRNGKASLLPGALFGCFMAAQLFAFFTADTAASGLGHWLLMLVGDALLAGVFLYVFAQIALIELPFGGLLRNVLFLMLGHPLRSLCAITVLLLYGAAVILFYPFSVLVAAFINLWLPAVCSLFIIYPVLEESLAISSRLKNLREENKASVK